jgi:DNA (cytosine-5)-methyltransferase 1
MVAARAFNTRIHVPSAEPPRLSGKLVDLFAGGGGAGVGVAQAVGRSADVAVNHWDAAIAMYRANHPETRTYISDVYQVDPRDAVGGYPVDLIWLSPDCTHHSKAAGGKPKNQRIRGLAWSVMPWVKHCRPLRIILENVEEFLQWGPLHKQHIEGCPGVACIKDCKFGTRGRGARRRARHAPGCPGCSCLKTCCFMRPIKARSGELFRAFVRKLEKYGYTVSWKVLKACDYGAPTTRKRLFLQAHLGNNIDIPWPEPTHGPGRAHPYRTAAEIIDWSRPCPSIFERNKPLADKTLARIARGIRKFVLDNPRPFIVPTNHGGTGRNDLRVHAVDEPMRTITGAQRGEHAVVTPVIVRTDMHQSNALCAYTAGEPLRTIMTDGGMAVAAPYLVHRGNGERVGQAPRVYDVQEPVRTTVAQGKKQALCVALITKHHGGHESSKGGQSPQAPLDTVTGQNSKALTVANLVRYNGDRAGAERVAAVGAPLTTQDTSNRHALVATHLIQLRGTTDAHLTASSSAADQPVPTVSAQGTHIAQVAAFLVRYNGESLGQVPDAPLGTLDTRDRYAAVTLTIAGELYEIVDIGMRMFDEDELFAANGFPDDYVIRLIGPRGKPLTKTELVRLCGNSVPPPLARAVVMAALGLDGGARCAA